LVFRRDGNCDVEVHDAAALEHEEHVQDAKRGCGNDKEVDGNEALAVASPTSKPSISNSP
jgi:hypothetical protein